MGECSTRLCFFGGLVSYFPKLVRVRSLGRCCSHSEFGDDVTIGGVEFWSFILMMEQRIMSNNQAVRQQLVNLLIERQAHMTFEDAVAKFPAEHINTRPPNVDYTFWHLIEHIRICQWDILDYIRNPDYTEPKFPEGVWPAPDATTDMTGWNRTIEQFLADRETLAAMVRDATVDLYVQIPHGYPGHNILREVLVVADHNAYHIGELGVLRQSMGLW